MTVENGIRAVAGGLVLVSLGMSHPRCPLFVSEYMLIVPSFVGFMLLQSAFTGFCPMAQILRKLGLKPAA